MAAEDLARRMVFVTDRAWAPWRSLKVRALDGLGRSSEAIALAHEKLEHARPVGIAQRRGVRTALLGRVHLRRRRPPVLREAVVELELWTSRLQLADHCGADARRRRLR